MELHDAEVSLAKFAVTRVCRNTLASSVASPVASQAGELLVTNFRVRFTAKRCKCESLEELGPPKWHSNRACEMRGPVSPWFVRGACACV